MKAVNETIPDGENDESQMMQRGTSPSASRQHQLATLLGDEEVATTEPSQVVCGMADFILSKLDVTQGMNATCNTSNMEEMVRQLHDKVCREPPAPTSTASSSQPGPSEPLPPLEGTGEDILSIAEDLATALDNMLDNVEADLWLESRRAVMLDG